MTLCLLSGSGSGLLTLGSGLTTLGAGLTLTGSLRSLLPSVTTLLMGLTTLRSMTAALSAEALRTGSVTLGVSEDFLNLAGVKHLGKLVDVLLLQGSQLAHLGGLFLQLSQYLGVGKFLHFRLLALFHLGLLRLLAT